MKICRTPLRARLIAALLCAVSCMTQAFAQSEPAWQRLEPAAAPVNNPLKGLVPYADAKNPEDFPHSMEFSYFPLSAVIIGRDRYDWRTLDQFLDAVAARGHQAIFRFYAEYPGKKNSLPDFLFSEGQLKILRSQRNSTPPRPPVEIETPDYSNPLLRETLVHFVAALGARYDGDARIAFITAGLLGHWGEWHDSPLDDQFADKALQADVMNAYEAAFHITPILLRYPSGDTDARYASNARHPFGYHDDSFAWGTLGTTAWFFMPRMRAAGEAALNKWQTQPIGGEIRPEAWGIVFDAQATDPRVQDFNACVEATHVTWLMDSGMFRGSNPQARRDRAREATRYMGYAFRIPRAALQLDQATLKVAIEIENIGVAPFYYDWPLQLQLLDAHDKVVRTQNIASGNLRHIQPAAPATLRTQALSLAGLPAGEYRVLLHASNPLPTGLPLRFANANQDRDMPGWLSLGSFVLP